MSFTVTDRLAIIHFYFADKNENNLSGFQNWSVRERINVFWFTETSEVNFGIFTLKKSNILSFTNEIKPSFYRIIQVNHVIWLTVVPHVVFAPGRSFSFHSAVGHRSSNCASFHLAAASVRWKLSSGSATKLVPPPSPPKKKEQKPLNMVSIT